MRYLVLILLLFLNHSYAAPARKVVRVEISSSPEGLVEKVGDPIVITATVKNVSSGSHHFSLDWKYNTVAFELEDPEPIPFALEAGQSRTFQVSFVQERVGFVEAQCLVSYESGRTVKAKKRVGMVPDAVWVSTKQDDFDQFWQQSLEQLAKVDPAFKVRRDASLANADYNVFEVSMQSFGDVTVRGWLQIPWKNPPKTSVPVVIRVPGYGGRVKPSKQWQDRVVFSFNPRAHGNSQDQVSGLPANYWLRGLDQKESYFYRGAFLDCIRAVDYIASLPNTDQDRIAIVGTSQGGGLAMVTAALDKRIDFCAPDIPFLCDWQNYLKLSHWPDMIRWVEAEQERTWESTFKTLSYFDAVNFADQIDCPVFMGIGLQDTICPPTTNFSAYHQIKGEKEYRLYPDKGHGLGKEHKEAVIQWLAEQFNQN